MHAFLQGARYLGRGLRQITQPGLRRWVIMPIVASALIYTLVFLLAADTLLPMIDGWLAGLPDWLEFIRPVIYGLLVIVALLFMAISFTLLANLVGSPFNGLLAEAVIHAHAPSKMPANPPTVMQSAVRSAGRESRKLLWIGSRAIVVVLLWLLSLLLFWVPGLNAVLGVMIAALWFLFGAWAMSVEYCDYPLDATGQPFANLKTWLRTQRMHTLGLGAACALLAMVPILNILVMPAGVCAGTLLWLDLQQDQGLQNTSPDTH